MPSISANGVAAVIRYILQDFRFTFSGTSNIVEIPLNVVLLICRRDSEGFEVIVKRMRGGTVSDGPSIS